MSKHKNQEVTVVLKNSLDNEVDRQNVIPPGSLVFSNLTRGNYKLCFCLLEGVSTPEPKNIELSFDGDIVVEISKILEVVSVRKTVTATTQTRKRSSPPPVRLIITVATGISIASAPPVIQNISAVSKVQIQKTPTQIGMASASRLPTSLKNRLLLCLKDNIKSMLEIPDLKVKNLAIKLAEQGKKGFIDDETEVQARQLYKNIERLRAIIKGCDPNLLKELIEAEKRICPTEQSEKNILVKGKNINIRAAPDANSTVVSQVSDTRIRLDLPSTAMLSEQEKLLIAIGYGWQPIILPDNQKGYIYSFYIQGCENEGMHQSPANWPLDNHQDNNSLEKGVKGLW